VNTAILKIAADNRLKATFNGEELINTSHMSPPVPNRAYLVVNLKDKLKGSSTSEYKLNVIEMEVTSDGYYEGVLYRVEITFTQS